MVGAEVRPGVGELLARFVQFGGKRLQVLALRGDLGGFQRSALYRFPRGFLAHAVGLRVGVLGVELQQPRGEDAGLLLRIDYVQFALELRQGRRRSLHLGFQFLELFFHEVRQGRGGAEPDAIGVLHIGARHRVGHVGGQARLRRAIADQQQVSVGWACHLQLPEQDGSVVLGLGRLLGRDVGCVSFKVEQMILLRHGPQHRVRLNQLHLGRQKLVGVVQRRASGVLADDGRRHLTVDIHRDRGFVNRRQPGGDDQRGRHAREHEDPDLPAVPAEDPKIVRQGHGGLLRRFDVVAVPAWLQGLIGSGESFGFGHRIRH